jgi:hypothetical protein
MRVDEYTRRIRRSECDVAEGLLGGILGEEEEKPEVEATAA